MKTKSKKKCFVSGTQQFHTINCRSDIIVPNVTAITGPISGETNIAAVIFAELFSMRPNAANALQIKQKKNSFENVTFVNLFVNQFELTLP